jgi:hypothetical protein
MTPQATPHVIVGHFNPHCAVCGRTVMQIQRQPDAPCQRHTLPFEEIENVHHGETFTPQADRRD